MVPSVGQRSSEMKRGQGAPEGKVRTSAVLKGKLLASAGTLIGSHRDILEVDEDLPKSQKHIHDS